MKKYYYNTLRNIDIYKSISSVDYPEYIYDKCQETCVFFSTFNEIIEDIKKKYPQLKDNIIKMMKQRPLIDKETGEDITEYYEKYDIWCIYIIRENNYDKPIGFVCSDEEYN